jgi:hypothetical protein
MSMRALFVPPHRPTLPFLFLLLLRQISFVGDQFLNRNQDGNGGGTWGKKSPRASRSIQLVGRFFGFFVERWLVESCCLGGRTRVCVCEKQQKGELSRKCGGGRLWIIFGRPRQFHSFPFVSILPTDRPIDRPTNVVEAHDGHHGYSAGLSADQKGREEMDGTAARRPNIAFVVRGE